MTLSASPRTIKAVTYTFLTASTAAAAYHNYYLSTKGTRLLSRGSNKPSFAKVSPSLFHVNSSLSRVSTAASCESLESSDKPPSPLFVDYIQDQFRVGDYYIWQYKDKIGQPSCEEKYEVTYSKDGIIMIEMSTRFVDDEEYSTHHRMEINIYKHLKSIQDRRDWTIGFEYLDRKEKAEGRGNEDDNSISKSIWKQFGTGDNVQAFEEKFDVFSMLNLTEAMNQQSLNPQADNRPPSSVDNTIRTHTIDLDNNKILLNRSKRHDYTGSWFAPAQHYLSGIAIMKNFTEHSFSLIKFKQRGGDVVDICVKET